MVTFLYPNSSQLKMEIQEKKISCLVAVTTLCLGIDLAKEIYWKHYKNVLRNIKQHMNKWKDILYYSLGKLNFIKISSIHKRYKSHIMPIRITLGLLLSKPVFERFFRAAITKDGNIPKKVLCNSIMLQLLVEMTDWVPYPLKSHFLQDLLLFCSCCFSYEKSPWSTE